jgi:rhodanese-related sulfurtransferase
MEKNKQQSKNNLVAIVTGFFLIVAVTALFFVKSSISNKNKQEKLSQAMTQQEEVDLEKYTSISPAKLLAKINSSENFEILDIRDADSFLSGHILDSKNVSLSSLLQDSQFLDRDEVYYIVDSLGFTPEQKQLIDAMQEEGFRKVGYLEGGIYAWINELNPIIEFGDPNSLSAQAKVNYISSDELKNLIEQEGDTLQIVDLRIPQKYIEGHLQDAINIPLESLETRRKEILSYKRIILYDDTGILAFQGAVRLFDMGTLNVFALSDGLNVWKEKGLEIVK